MTSRSSRMGGSLAAATLSDGKILIAGGSDSGNAAGLNGNETVARAELYTP